MKTWVGTKIETWQWYLGNSHERGRLLRSVAVPNKNQLRIQDKVL